MFTHFSQKDKEIQPSNIYIRAFYLNIQIKWTLL